MRQYLGLAIGLVVGVAGAVLFQQSLPPEEGSMQEELEQARISLQEAQREIVGLRAEGRGTRGERSVRDGMRTIAEKIRDGEDVSLDDVFWTMKPFLRDVSPLIDRLRLIEQEDHFDSLAGQLTREYNLTDGEREELKQWFLRKSEENAREFNEVIFSESSGFVDFVRIAEHDWDDVDGLDAFMEARLEGEELGKYREERLFEKIDSIQDEANRRLHRLDEAVDLDEDQLDAMFGVMARGSRRYEEGMDFDGMGTDTGRLEGRARDRAIREILRPEQLQRYEDLQAQRKQAAEKEMRRVGMTLPKDWDLLDDEMF